jgi:cysteinyl-tRNA synthetase
MNVTRFAPSPTGNLHIGNIRGCLMPYLWSIKNNAKFIFRIDDTDQARSKQKFVNSIYSDIDWLGVKYDYTFRQSEKNDRYKHIIELCIKAGIVYPVYDNSEEVEQIRRFLSLEKKAPAYKVIHAKKISGREVYWRFNIGSQIISFNDGIKGNVTIDLSSISDPVICKPSGEFTYIFASVVDDLCENVSCIIRGGDHLSNTAIQVCMFDTIMKHNIFTKREISFGHYPLFIDSGNNKISKRNNALSISSLKNDLHPLSIAHYVNFVGSNEEIHTYDSMDLLAEEFSLSHYSSSNVVEFDLGELYRWQKRVMLSVPYKEIRRWYDSKIELAWNIVKESVISKKDIAEWENILLTETSYPTLIGNDINKDELVAHIDNNLIEYIKKCFNGNTKKTMMFLRQILTGKQGGPKVPDLLNIIPTNIIEYRLRNFYNLNISIYNTISKQKEIFKPINDHSIKMYACGPTVYHSPHIGNARSFVVFDVMYRLLRHFYKDVIYVRNVTDIDDKIINAAKEKNITTNELTESVYEEFSKDMENLNLLRPTFEPKVTDYIPQIVSYIQKMLDNGFAYSTDDGIYFNIGKLTNYDIFNAVSTKNDNNNDFVLWKFRDKDDASWDSPWGHGRPGWHIECTAMSGEILGFPFDIHCGGQDLIFPHHTNECAQSCGLGHDKTANYWMHNNFINIEEIKMSKSLNNFVTLNEIKTHPMIIRLALLMSHYRHPLNWSTGLLSEATSLYNKWRRILGKHLKRSFFGGSLIKEFTEAIADDLNTPLGIRVLDTEVSKCSENSVDDILYSFELLGIKFDFEYLHDDSIISLVNSRQEAKKAKDFAKADAIRTQLEEIRVELEEGREKVYWYQRVE